VPTSPVRGGAVDGTVAFRGTLERPTLSAEITARELIVPDRPPMDVWALVTLEEQRLALALDAQDPLGVLAIVRAEGGFGWEDLVGGRLLERLDDTTFSLEIEAPPRSLHSLGLAEGPLQGLPLEVSLSANFAREARSLPTGDIHLVLRALDGDAAEEVVEEAREQATLPVTTGECLGARPAVLTVDAHLHDGESQVTFDLRLGARSPLTWTVTADTPIARWIDTGTIEEVPAIAAELLFDDLALRDLPIVCREVGGTLDGHLTATGLLTDDPRIELSLLGSDLAFKRARPVMMEITGSLDTERLQANAEVTGNGTGLTTIRLDAPVVWGGPDAPAPQMGDGPLSLRADLERFHIAPLAPIVPMLSRGQGYVDGFIEITGRTDALEPTGDLRLSELVVTVEGLDQRLSDVSGRLLLTRNELRLEDLRARDREGTIRLDATVTMDGLTPTEVRATLRTEEFPMRQAGLIVARLSSEAAIRASFGEDHTDVSVVFSDLGIRLPELAARNVQTLDPNPDIVFVDAAGVAARPEDPGNEAVERLAEETVALLGDEADEASARVEQFQERGPGSEPPPPPPTPIVLRIDATQPFWVQRSDFSIQLTANLRLQIDDRNVFLSGPVELRRGTLDLLTKTFELEEGEIMFTGSAEVDPMLTIVAVHHLARYPGDTVTATIHGYLSEPTLEFSTTVPGVESEAEIVQLLITGRVDSQEPTGGSPENDVASFLGGLTAGLLTMTARSEFGDAVPIISVQTGDDLRDVQVRAGFVADRLVPRFLRGIVTGMYIEGFVSTQTEENVEDQATDQVTTGGVLIELYFPNGWLLSSSFQPPINWGLDVLWQP
jgi:hypothetical protein